MKITMKVVIVLFLFLFVGCKACDSSSYSSWVRATGDWPAAKGHPTWAADEPLGLMVFDATSCTYKSDPISGLPVGTSYLWKVTIGNSWTESYGCGGTNCQFVVPASGSVIFQFSYSTKQLTVINVGGISPSPTLSPTPVTSAPTTVSSGSGNQVFAHFMIGNAYGYTQAHFESDMILAKNAGLDAFALNVGQDSWSNDRLNKAYAAAAAQGFKCFLSFDMNYWSTTASIIAQVKLYGNLAGQYKYNSKIFVSTFGGSWVNMGNGGVNNDWNVIKTTLANSGYPIFLVPNFAVDASTIYNQFPVIDGAFSWGAWPSPDVSITGDSAFMTGQNSANKVYMAPWSPGFYTHLSYKNYIYDTDALWYTRWQQLLTLKPQMIEIITWNDWGEAHYIGPIDTDQSDWPAGSADYVAGFDHSAFLNTLPYFISYYKNGVAPAVTQDIVVYWYRPFLKASTASADPYGQPAVYNQDMSNAGKTPSQVLSDTIYVITILRAAGTIQVTSGGVTTTQSVPAGHNLYSTTLRAGIQSVTLLRNNVQLCTNTGAISVGTNPTKYNYNIYTGGCKY